MSTMTEPKLTDIYKFLSPELRRDFLYSLVVSTISNFLSCLGIGLIFPFMSLVNDPQGFKLKVTEFTGLTIGFPDDQLVVGSTYGLVSIFVIKMVFQLYTNYVSSRTPARIVSWLIDRMFKKYLDMKFEDYEKVNKETAFHLLITTTQRVGILVEMKIKIFHALLVSVLLLSLILVKEKLTVIFVVFIFLLPFGLLFKGLKARIREAGKTKDSVLKELCRLMEQYLSSFSEIVVYQVEGKMRAKISQGSDKLARANIAIDFFPSFFTATIESILVIILLLVTVYVKSNNLMSFDQFLINVLFYGAIGRQLIPSVINYFNLRSRLYSLIPSWYETLEELGPQIPKPEPKLIQEFQSLAVDHLRFSAGGKHILNDLSLKVEKGEKIALVGSSGSGKTTLAKVLMGLYRPTDGQVLVNGQDEKNFAWSSKIIGYVPQGPVIISEDIATNIGFFRGENPEKVSRLQEMLRLQNLKTTGDVGIISGGEKQRVGIARSLFLDPEVIFIDEGTSALDKDNEANFMRFLMQLPKDKTVIMISHNLHILGSFDRIYVLSKGKIVESGKHDELIRSETHYKKLWLSSLQEN